MTGPAAWARVEQNPAIRPATVPCHHTGRQASACSPPPRRTTCTTTNSTQIAPSPRRRWDSPSVPNSSVPAPTPTTVPGSNSQKLRHCHWRHHWTRATPSHAINRGSIAGTTSVAGSAWAISGGLTMPTPPPNPLLPIPMNTTARLTKSTASQIGWWAS